MIASSYIPTPVQGQELLSLVAFDDCVVTQSKTFLHLENFPVTQVGTPVLSNVDFESTNPLTKTDFSEFGSSVSTFSVSSVNPISGTQSANLVVTTPSVHNRPFLSFTHERAVELGKRYRLKFDYRVNSGTCTLRGIQNGIGFWNEVNIPLTGTGTLIRDFVSLGSHPGMGRFSFGGSQFDLTIDNVSLTEIEYNQVDVVFLVNGFPANSIDPHIVVNGTTTSFLFDDVVLSRGDKFVVYPSSPLHGSSGYTVVVNPTDGKVDSTLSDPPLEGVVFYHEGKVPASSTLLSTVVPKPFSPTQILFTSQSAWTGAGTARLSLRRNNTQIGYVDVSLSGATVFLEPSVALLTGERLTLVTPSAAGQFLNDGLRDISLTLL